MAAELRGLPEALEMMPYRICGEGFRYKVEGYRTCGGGFRVEGQVEGYSTCGGGFRVEG